MLLAWNPCLGSLYEVFLRLQRMNKNMEVAINRNSPQIIHLNGIFQCQPSILGYPCFSMAKNLVVTPRGLHPSSSKGAGSLLLDGSQDAAEANNDSRLSLMNGGYIGFSIGFLLGLLLGFVLFGLIGRAVSWWLGSGSSKIARARASTVFYSRGHV